MRMQSNADFVDMQVKLLIRKFPDCTIRELVINAEKLFPMFKWNYHKIRNSINRIKKTNEIIITYCKEFKNNIINRNYIISQRYKQKRFRMLIVNDKLK